MQHVSTRDRNREQEFTHHAPQSAEHQSLEYAITVVGLGYVGLPFAVNAMRSGYNVRGIDTNHELITRLRAGHTPTFLDYEDAKKLIENAENISYSEEISSSSDAFVVCVPTPVGEHKIPDLRPLTKAAKMIAPHITRGTLVVIESTVNPGVCEEIVLPLLEAGSKLAGERDFYFAHCPERVNPGDPNWTTATIPRVLGALGPRSEAAAYELYSHLIRAEITRMGSLKEAEAVKMVENTFRDINIAFVNELAMAFGRAGIDTVHVIDGAATKPFGFMAHYPGCGVGGHCIPVDPYYLIQYGKQNGFTHRFIEIARTINNSMPIHTVDLLEAQLRKKGRSIQGNTIALLGLSYKRNIPDMRESPANDILKELEARGAYVQTFDPLALSHSTALTVEEALNGASSAIVATDHTAFSALGPEDFMHHGVDVLIDGRNMFDKELFLASGMSYSGIGR